MYETRLYDILAHSGAHEVLTEAPKGPLGALEVLGGPWMSLEGPKGPDLVPTDSGWSNWVGHIHIMCFGPLRDL